MREFFRKRMVHLKRKPEVLPLLSIIVACCVYTFNLANYSNAAIFVKESYVAIIVFATTLLSILSFVTYLNVHKGKKTNYIMLVLTLAILGAMVFFDIVTRDCVVRTIAEEHATQLAQGTELVDRPVLIATRSDIVKHLIWLIVSIALVVLKPVYATLFQKVNTAVKDDEFAGEMEDESDEDITSGEE